MSHLMDDECPEQYEKRVGREVDDARQVVEQREQRLAIQIEIHKEIVLLLAAIYKIYNRKEHCAHCNKFYKVNYELS